MSDSFHLTPQAARALAAEYRAGLTDEQRAQEDVEQEAEHDAEITMWRTTLGRTLDHARKALTEARAANDALCSDTVYDVEFADGGAGTDIAALVADAGRLTRAALALFERATR